MYRADGVPQRVRECHILIVWHVFSLAYIRGAVLVSHRHTEQHAAVADGRPTQTPSNPSRIQTASLLVDMQAVDFSSATLSWDNRVTAGPGTDTFLSVLAQRLPIHTHLL